MMWRHLWCFLFHRKWIEDGMYYHPAHPWQGMIARYGDYKVNCWDRTCLKCGWHWCHYGDLGYQPAVEYSKQMLERVVRDHEKVK
jgi:hypothetical protein